MEQAVIAARGPVGQVGPLDERDAQAPQRQVQRRAPARCPSADDEDIEGLRGVHGFP